MHKVFVYGSLKTGFSNHYLLSETKSEFIGNAVTVSGRYLMHALGESFPAVVRSKDIFEGRHIAGEIYEVTDEVLEKCLDKLEGNGHLYNRELVDVYVRPVKNGPAVVDKAWIYVFMHNLGMRSTISGIVSSYVLIKDTKDQLYVVNSWRNLAFSEI